MDGRKKLTEDIKRKAKEIGFHLVHITSADPLTAFSFYHQWIEKGYHGEMQYLEKHLDKKSDPKSVFPQARSIICCGLSYHTRYDNPRQARPGRGLISNYAWGEDYHKIMEKKLKTLLKTLQQWTRVEGKYYADTGPILERSLAERAGMGWIGKNTCLINQTYGSYLFLGEILVNLDLEVERAETDHCGSCVKCLEACPTGALVGPYEMDATRCISYLTIEKRGEFKNEQKEMIGDHVFGCDVCQQVCPWNDKALTPDLDCFKPREGVYEPELRELKALSQHEFENKFIRSPLKRAKYKGLKRNIEAILETKGRKLASV